MSDRMSCDFSYIDETYRNIEPDRGEVIFIISQVINHSYRLKTSILKGEVSDSAMKKIYDVFWETIFPNVINFCDSEDKPD